MDLFFRKIGTGEPLIIVHGLYGSSDNWLSIARKLESNFTCYLIDQRNHGRSPHTSSHTYEDMVLDLKLFMEQQGIEKASLIGHSMGGKTVMKFALDYPEMVNKMVVVDIAPKPYTSFSNYGNITADHNEILAKLNGIDLSVFTDRNTLNARFEALFPDARLRMFLLKNIKRVDGGLLDWKFNLSALYAHILDIMDGFSKETRSNTTIEVLFIKGEDSPYIDVDDLFLIRNTFPNSNLTTIPKAGHWLHYEKPEILLNTLDYFLN